GPAQNVEASPDLQLALASLGEESDELQQRRATRQARASVDLEDQIPSRAQALTDSRDRGAPEVGPNDAHGAAPGVHQRSLRAGHRNAVHTPDRIGQIPGAMQ